MQMISISTILSINLTLLKELYEGVPASEPTWAIDNGPGSGILAVARGVNAAEASVSVDASGSRGTTIAAHIEHLHWSLAQVNRTLRGEPWQSNWSESWDLLHADEAGWDRLRGDLRQEYERLRDVLAGMVASPENLPELDEDALTGTLALAPHAAYHLGTLLQMVERARAR